MAVTVERTIAYVLKEADIVLPPNGQQSPPPEVVLATPPEIGMLFARLGPIRIQQPPADGDKYSVDQLKPLLQSAVDELNATAVGRTYSLGTISGSVYRPGNPWWFVPPYGGISAALLYLDTGGAEAQPLRAQLASNGIQYMLEYHLVADIPTAGA